MADHSAMAIDKDTDQQAPGAAARPPTPVDIGWMATITVAKATVVALAADAFIHANEPRYQGKGMRLRAIGYLGGMMVVPAAWRALGRREPYPRELDLAVTAPLLIDAGANAIGVYRGTQVDDVVHFVDGAVVASVVGALATPRLRTSWEAALAGTLAGGTLAGLWEIGEWVGLKVGAKGMDLSYDDTMTDLIETMAGAALGGVVTLRRHPSRLRRVPGGRGDRLVATRPSR